VTLLTRPHTTPSAEEETTPLQKKRPRRADPVVATNGSAPSACLPSSIYLYSPCDSINLVLSFVVTRWFGADLVATTQNPHEKGNKYSLRTVPPSRLLGIAQSFPISLLDADEPLCRRLLGPG
jgi:hypothetical protein